MFDFLGRLFSQTCDPHMISCSELCSPIQPDLFFPALAEYGKKRFTLASLCVRYGEMKVALVEEGAVWDL